MADFRVRRLVDSKGMTAFGICVKQDNRLFVARYAYASFAQAEQTMDILERDFGNPAGIEVDLAYNYWRFDKGIKEFVQRTTSKTTLYLIMEDAVSA